MYKCAFFSTEKLFRTKKKHTHFQQIMYKFNKNVAKTMRMTATFKGYTIYMHRIPNLFMIYNAMQCSVHK